MNKTTKTNEWYGLQSAWRVPPSSGTPDTAPAGSQPSGAGQSPCVKPSGVPPSLSHRATQSPTSSNAAHGCGYHRDHHHDPQQDTHLFGLGKTIGV